MDVLGELLPVFRRYSNDAAAEAGSVGMNNQELAMNDAIAVELDFDADRFIGIERKIRVKLQTLFCQIVHFADGRLLTLRHEATPSDDETELTTLVCHRHKHPEHPSETILSPYDTGPRQTSSRHCLMNSKGDMGRLSPFRRRIGLYNVQGQDQPYAYKEGVSGSA